MKKFKVWDYLNEYKQEKKEIKKSIDKVLNSGWLILGEQVKLFEMGDLLDVVSSLWIAYYHPKSFNTTCGF